MTTIEAWQHIYSNVEKEQSPKGKGGFQTLFYSAAGLSQAEVSEMEGRLLYFSSKVEPVKRLFFSTSTGKSVVAQIVVLSEPDKYGRKGRYLAHSLIFTAEALAQFEADPFRVFRQFSFIDTIAGALEQGNFETGDIPSVTLDLPEKSTGDIEAAKQWSVSNLKKLALLALRVDKHTQDREAITFSGGPQDIEKALEASFLVVPRSMRPRCIFDTYFYRCNLVATYFWAIGLPEAPVSIKFVLVDGQSRQIEGAASESPQTAYEHWALAAIQAGQLDTIARERDVAFALASWLDNVDYDPVLLEKASNNLIEAVFKVNPTPARNLLHTQISEHLSDVLAERATNYIFQQLQGVALYQRLRQSFTLEELVEILYKSYEKEKFAQPSRAEIKALTSLLKEIEYEILSLFLAYWYSPRKQLPRDLAEANENIYRQFVEMALRLNLIKPFNMLITGRADAFLDVYLKGRVPEMLDLVDALVDVEETACLPRLNKFVSPMPNKELRKLGKYVERVGDTIPESFQKTVEEAVAKLPPERGILSMVRRLWGGE